MTTEAVSSPRAAVPGEPDVAGPRGAVRRRFRGDAETEQARLAHALAWLGIGLGVAELAAPRSVGRLIGLPDSRRRERILRGLGAGGIAGGVAVLAVARFDAGRRLVGLGAGGRHLSLRSAVTIERSPDEVYRFWRDFENLPRFMEHLESVEVTDTGRSRWRAKPAAGARLEWESEVVEDRPGERIAWRSIGGDVEHEGSVLFRPAPGGRGTEVVLDVSYAPPGGAAGAAIARLLDPATRVAMRNDLRRFKQVMETGHLVRSDASIHGGPHPARPAPAGEEERR
jgi:uncharacterized membrane protein